TSLRLAPETCSVASLTSTTVPSRSRTPTNAAMWSMMFRGSTGYSPTRHEDLHDTSLNNEERRYSQLVLMVTANFGSSQPTARHECCRLSTHLSYRQPKTSVVEPFAGNRVSPS